MIKRYCVMYERKVAFNFFEQEVKRFSSLDSARRAAKRFSDRHPRCAYTKHRDQSAFFFIRDRKSGFEENISGYEVPTVEDVGYY